MAGLAKRLQHQGFLDATSHGVKRSVESLSEKMLLHGKHQASRELLRLSAKLDHAGLSAPEAVLRLLLELSRAPARRSPSRGNASVSKSEQAEAGAS
eukprot:7441276-Prorocentrum_lima.AAC.1